jgi:hypothetical protein
MYVLCRGAIWSHENAATRSKELQNERSEDTLDVKKTLQKCIEGGVEL